LTILTKYDIIKYIIYITYIIILLFYVFYYIIYINIEDRGDETVVDPDEGEALSRGETRI